MVPLLFVGCDIGPSTEGLWGRPDDPEAVEAEVQRVFDDAACWCESYVLIPYEAADTPASLEAQRLYRVDVIPLGDPPLLSFVQSTTTAGVEGGDIRACHLSPDSARGSLSDRTWKATDVIENACTGWPTASISHALCRADFDGCLGRELALAAGSSTRPLPSSVRSRVLAESARRLASSAALGVAERNRLKSTCIAGSTDADCVRLATGFDTALILRAAEATSATVASDHDLVAAARTAADRLTPGHVQGGRFGEAVFGSSSSRVAMMQSLYGATAVASSTPVVPPSGGSFGLSSSVLFSTHPANLTAAAFRSNQIRFLIEQQNLPLTAPLTLSGPGAPVLPIGTRVNVYLVHYAPTASLLTHGDIGFDRRVLGILSSDSQVVGTHGTLGRSGVVYPIAAGTGVEAGDTVTVGIRSVSVDLQGTSSSFDELRIVTLATPDAPATVVASERAGDLPYAARLYGDARTQRALGLLSQYRIAFPHTACVNATTGEVTASLWAADPPAEAANMLQALELAVGVALHGPTWSEGSTSIVLDTYGLRESDIADAIDYVRDAEAVLDGIVLAPASGCGPSILRATSVGHRNILPLQAAFARGGTGALGGSSGSTSWYTPTPAQLRAVGTVGAAQIARTQLVTTSVTVTDPALTASISETLSLLDVELGTSWSEWRVCDNASGCDSDPVFAARWSLFERNGTQRPAGVPVLVSSASDARCLVRGREPLAPATGTCAHVTSSSTRYRAMTPVSTGGTMPGSCPAGSFGFDPYCRRSFTVPDMRTAAPDDRRFVLWCAREAADPPLACRSYELVDVIYTGAGPQVHAFGGDVAAAVLESFLVDPIDPAIPMITSLGLPHDFVPPLENELSENGDSREDSWATHLAAAQRAQVQASQLLAAARQHELEQLAYERTVAAQLESAALAQQEVVSELCGADTPEADCAVPRHAPITLHDLGVVREPAAVPTSPGVPVGMTCANFDQNLAPVPEDRDEWFERLDAVLVCGHYQIQLAVSRITLRDLPEAVVQEVLAASGGALEAGQFGGYAGQTRQEFIALFNDLEALRTSMADFEAVFHQAASDLKNRRSQYDDISDSWWDTLSCAFRTFLRAAAVLGTLAAVAVVTGGVGAAIGAAAGTGLAAGAILSEYDACSSQDRDREEILTAAFGELVGRMNSLQQLVASAGVLVRRVASTDGRFDDMAREVELARRRREIAERLATSGIEGDPTWRALLGVERRRADRALVYAQRSAFIARRAIETRLAIDMTTMTSPIADVEAPAFWANDVFDLLDAVEYGEVDDVVVAVDVRAEAVEGYVSLLEQFVPAYAEARRFEAGEDVQVVNLGEILRLDPANPDVITPFVSTVLFQCKAATGPLPGGMPSGAVVDPLDPPAPCGVFVTPTGTVDLGGVDHAVFSFNVPVDLDRGYFGERFAGGNFNYRIRDVGVNLVGRALFDCERSSRPTECYGDGNVQYSMRHDGDTVLENYEYEQRRFAFEPGVINRARAVADERWLTNPLSSTDTALLAPYARAEWWGRPLAGTYTLAVFGREEMEWRNLENVQVLMRYHYWTRQE